MTIDWNQYRVEPKQGERPPSGFKPGSARCMCVVCWEKFSGWRAFDRHRKGRGDDRFCVNPESAGLIQRENGDWTRRQAPPKI